ncbi:Cystathionine gamma-synthase [Fusarium acutatum]|uniref:Cystathionine gamma-synthase n=1 Tax=Fusarium acutatum TaxID=78861 RepID=A0A8H4K151_9HYPO|nr:Cystathionine gamma-synthase [Fusarium acutatum]
MNLEILEEELAAGLELCALFTEFPGNPLLGSVDLERIKSLSDEFFFLFVVDDTVVQSGKSTIPRETRRTQRLYEKYKRPGKGYGYLLSIRFNTPAAAIAFHDALDVVKGPSLGTNFTLGCAYTLFVPFHELEWTERYGVVEHLVRISVGIENGRFLDEVIKTALDAAD